MTIRSRLKDSVGIIVGAIGLLVALLVILHDYKQPDPVAQLVVKHQRIALVEGMRLALSTASEAAKNAVMAITDSESQTFADRARTATNAVDQGREELARLLETGGNRSEVDLLASFSQAFADYLRIDHALLDLAVKNTNLKAYSLAFGPAAESIHEMDQALSSIITESANSNSPQARQVMLLAGAGHDRGAANPSESRAAHFRGERRKDGCVGRFDRRGGEGSPKLSRSSCPAHSTRREHPFPEGRRVLCPVHRAEDPDSGSLAPEHERPILDHVPQ